MFDSSAHGPAPPVHQPILTASDLLTTPDVADLLKVRASTVRQWVHSGELSAIDLGRKAGFRFKRSDIDNFLALRRRLQAVHRE